MIAGPTLGTYDRATIVDFLAYCLANGCEANSLTWHALNDADVAALPVRTTVIRAAHLEEIRAAVRALETR